MTAKRRMLEAAINAGGFISRRELRVLVNSPNTFQKVMCEIMEEGLMVRGYLVTKDAAKAVRSLSQVERVASDMATPSIVPRRAYNKRYEFSHACRDDIEVSIERWKVIMREMGRDTPK